MMRLAPARLGRIGLALSLAVWALALAPSRAADAPAPAPADKAAADKAAAEKAAAEKAEAAKKPAATTPTPPPPEAKTGAKTAPAADATAVTCPRAVPIHLPALHNADIRQILPLDQTAIPSGDRAHFTVAGQIESKTTAAAPLVFRVFTYAKPVPYDGASVTVSGQYFEQVPTSVTVANPNTSGETHDISFILHDFDAASGAPGAAAERFDWTHLKTDRGILYVACRGDDLAAWGFRGITTSSRLVAQVWAAILVAAIYVLGASFVYLRRSKAAQKTVTGQKLYRIETVKKWSFLKCLNPIAMTADNFDRGSLSKLQILGFTLLVAYNLAYLVLWQNQLFALSTSVAFLLGIPALGTLGTQVATTTRDRFSADNWAWMVSKHVLPLNDPGAGAGPTFSDLVMSDSELDLYKLQALTFSVIVGVSLMAAGPKGLGQFQVPDTLLQVLGLSQLVLVGGRFAKPATIGDIDDMVTELRARLAVVIRAATTGVDVDENGKPLAQTVDATGKAINVPASPPLPLPATLADAYPTVPTAVKRYRDTAAEVQVLLEAMSHRSVESDKLLNPALST
jgi:hypothetical protein